jgi:hypothetical protein
VVLLLDPLLDLLRGVIAAVEHPSGDGHGDEGSAYAAAAASASEIDDLARYLVEALVA